MGRSRHDGGDQGFPQDRGVQATPSSSSHSSSHRNMAASGNPVGIPLRVMSKAGIGHLPPYTACVFSHKRICHQTNMGRKNLAPNFWEGCCESRGLLIALILQIIGPSLKLLVDLAVR